MIELGQQYESIPEDIPTNTEKRSNPSINVFSQTKLHLYAPLILSTSLVVGTAFYWAANDWRLSTCYFFAAQALLGDMYDVPGNETTFSKGFTILYFIYGEFLVVGALAQFADRLVALAPAIAQDERRRVKKSQTVDIDGNEVVECNDLLDYSLNNFLVQVNWAQYRSKYICSATLIMWICLGVVFGVSLEGYSILEALYFSIGAVSTAGVFPPQCT